MSVLILDAGNSIIKAKIARRENGEISFSACPAAIDGKRIPENLIKSQYQWLFHRLYPGEWSTLCSRCECGGGMASFLNDLEQPGTPEIIMVFLPQLPLVKLYGRGREVAVFGSHAPGDVKFREDLMRSVIGDWEVEIGDGKSNFKVIYANTFDEPVGGLMNVLLTEDGQHYQHAQVGNGRTLVIDIGGFTTDFLAVNPGGEVDYSLARSVPLGIQTVINDFEESFKSNNAEVVKDTPILPPDRIRKGHCFWCV